MAKKSPLSTPQVSSESQKELDRIEAQFDKFHEEVKQINIDSMAGAKKQETEPQTKLSQEQIQKNNDLYLKPVRTVSSAEKFNEAFREDYNFSKEYVNFIAEHKELIGEKIEKWTKPFPGMPAEYWEVPTNRPVWGPRYLAESIKAARYHKFSMSESDLKNTSPGYEGTYVGRMISDTIVQRLDAHPVSSRKSVFMGASGF